MKVVLTAVNGMVVVRFHGSEPWSHRLNGQDMRLSASEFRFDPGWLYQIYDRRVVEWFPREPHKLKTRV